MKNNSIINRITALGVSSFLFSLSAHAVGKTCRDWLKSEYAMVDSTTGAAHFEPSFVLSPEIDLSTLTLNPNELGGGNGTDGAVFGGKLGSSNNVVVKFFKKKRLTKDEEKIRIKQSYFMLKVVSDAGLAPKPYGFVSDAKVAEALAQKAGLDPTAYYGAVIVERINPIFTMKNYGVAQSLPSTFKRTIKNSLPGYLEKIRKLGLIIVDPDFIIDAKGRFNFLDLDYWQVKSGDQVWNNGSLEKNIYPDSMTDPRTLLRDYLRPLQD